MLYEYYEKRIKDELQILPKELCLMLAGSELAEDPKKLLDLLKWVKEFPEIQRFILHISTDTPESVAIPFDALAEITQVRMSSPDGEKTAGSGLPEVLVVVGQCGRQEIADAIAKIAASGMKPEDITEETIEQNLLYQVTPDFVIKTGGSHLTDFLIWQSVYSELFFTDVNWAKFRRVDFLRALRDFQSRNRRFGK